MNHRVVALLVVLGGVAALGIVYWAQYVQLLVPCPLCLWERWPYRVIILIGLVALMCRPPAGRFFLGLAAITLLGGAIIASIHVGVEMRLWNSPLPECNGILTPGAPLPMTPSKSCEDPTYLIPWLPISMAAMDLIYALGLAVFLMVYIARKPRRFIR